MSAKTEVVASKFDFVMWAAIIAIFIVGVVLNFHFAYVAVSIRIAAWIVASIVLGLIALQTYHGRIFFNFTKDVRMELRKVVWPSRQQIIQTTGLVIVAVIVFALILWAIDSSLLFAVNKLTG